MMRLVFSLVIVSALGGWTAQPARGQHQHAGDIIVAHNGAGQLAVEFDFNADQVLPAVNGLLTGWAGDEPGFDHLAADEPAEGLYTLAEGAQITFEVVAFSPALKAWTPGFAAALALPGDAYAFPDGHLLHGHLDWHIDSTDAAFDPLQTEWLAEFRLIDHGTTDYLESDIFTLHFTNVPEPGMALGMTLGLALAAGRRQRAVEGRI